MLIKTFIRFYLYFLIIFTSAQGFSQSVVSSGRPAKTMQSGYARKGTLLDMSVYYGQTEATANPSALNQWQNTTSIYDIKLGHILENNFYLGAMYSTRNDNQVSISAANGSGIGVGGGYFYASGFNLRAYYKLNEAYENYTNGSGYQADLGYSFNLASNFMLGVALSVKQTVFKTNSSILLFDSWTRKEVYPFLTLGFIFN